MILQITHFVMVPFAAALAIPRGWAALFSFCTIFCLWCIHFNALDLEFPFGTRVNDLPMDEMQQDWNKSLCTLIDKRGSRPPAFAYDATVHGRLEVLMSDQSELYVPVNASRIRGGKSRREGTSVRTSATACTDSLKVGGLATGRTTSSIGPLGTDIRPSIVTVPGGHDSQRETPAVTARNSVDKFAEESKPNSQGSIGNHNSAGLGAGPNSQDSIANHNPAGLAVVVENHNSAGLAKTSAEAERLPDLITANDGQISSDAAAPSALQLMLSERNSALDGAGGEVDI